MRRFYAEQFFTFAAIFQSWQSEVQTEQGELKLEVSPGALRVLELAKEVLKRNELPMSESLAAEQLARLKSKDSVTHAEFVAMMPVLRSSIERELRLRLFMLIPPDQAKHYDLQAPFAQHVNDAFPSAIGDMVEAGNCYAVGRSTACVFHLMRVVEKGVRALADKLGVPLAKEWDWNDLLEQAKKRLKELNLKGTQFDDYWNVIQTLYAIKNGSRNPTVHVRRDYTQEQAEALIVHVRQFMQQLVDFGVSEPRRRRRSPKQPPIS